VEELELTCACGTVLRTPAENVGATVVCPACGKEQVIPAPARAVASRSAAPPGTGPAAASPAATRVATAPCPFCHEPIRPTARKCPHCQEYLDPALARAARKAPRISALAVASFVLAVISPLFLFVPGVLAFMLGVLGMVATSRGRAGGRGLAVYGMLLGLLWTVLLIALLSGLASAIVSGHFPQVGPRTDEPLF
jgi:hypothetical protein